jgi:hypothetical protein
VLKAMQVLRQGDAKVHGGSEGENEMRGKSKYHDNDEAKLPALSVQEREEIHDEPRLQEIREWLARLKGERERYWLSDSSFSTVSANVDFLLRREDIRENHVAFLRKRWLKKHIECMKMREQLSKLRTQYGVKETQSQRQQLKRLDRQSIAQLEKVAIRLEDAQER